MANKRSLSDAELELELLHGLPEDCSDPESNVSDKYLSPASDSDKDFIPPPSNSSDCDENLKCVQSLESCTCSVNQVQIDCKRKRSRGREISRGKRCTVGQLRGRSSNFISYAFQASTSNCSQPESGNATSEACVTIFHEENGARSSLKVGSCHAGKDKSTIWIVTAHNNGRFSAQNVLKEAQVQQHMLEGMLQREAFQVLGACL
ncbi:hypothetical protein ILUMI_23139 [Ignelater luminosus]|uniref:Uncharacterized protein n=1 Tax=Ignelater luminosus TaxID=2038154 RepID=A0A8K0G1X8_IGNLU|nr:hypothetical protein ILUMI_23139 [Ignelater luminosus]